MNKFVFLYQKYFCFFILLFSGFAFINSVHAQDDEVITLEATVTGNQEQPKVLTIVPWKPAKDDSLLYQPLSSLMTDVFSHVERSEHQRHIEFIEELEK